MKHADVCEIELCIVVLGVCVEVTLSDDDEVSNGFVDGMDLGEMSNDEVDHGEMSNDEMDKDEVEKDEAESDAVESDVAQVYDEVDKDEV